MHDPWFSEGQQPCDNFTPDEQAEWFGRVTHQCPICWGSREFCLNCRFDHHKDGWENCTKDAYKPVDEADTPCT